MPFYLVKRKRGVKVNGLSCESVNAYEIHTVWGGAGGKAWFGGLACSELAGYRTCRSRGNASDDHFYPLIGFDVAIIPRATDTLLTVNEVSVQTQ